LSGVGLRIPAGRNGQAHEVFFVVCRWAPSRAGGGCDHGDAYYRTELEYESAHNVFREACGERHRRLSPGDTSYSDSERPGISVGPGRQGSHARLGWGHRLAQLRSLEPPVAPTKDGKPVRFRVTLDGTAPGDNYGSDSTPSGTGEVREPRLYQLIRQRGQVKDRTFEIEFLDPGVQAFDFTFG
jgi:hypothetical protein